MLWYELMNYTIYSYKYIMKLNFLGGLGGRNSEFNLEDFSEEYRKTAPMKCFLYLASCLDKDIQTQLKKDWNEAGGVKLIPYWKWCMCRT